MSSHLTRTKDLNIQELPILSADELLSRMGIDIHLRDWRTLIGLDDSIFNPYVQQPFYRFAEAIQLSPASESDHHAGPGGLLVHTYDVITIALKKRRGIQLPKGGSVDQINAQRHLWTYAVFAAGLLHDIGKLLGSIRILVRLGNGQELAWTPHDVPLNQYNLARSYRIEFFKTPYTYHTQVALTLFDFLPRASRAWLARDPIIMMQLCAYLRGDRFESGVIGEILESADMTSTAAAQLRPITQRFNNKPSTIERLIHFVRNWLAEGEIKVNKNGGMAWLDNHGHIFIVCRALADKIIHHCDDLGIADLPRDPIRLYDIFQDYGLALPTIDNRAIWSIQISCDEYTHHFTCLKFEARRLFTPTRIPRAFEGFILEESAVKKPETSQPPYSESSVPPQTKPKETEPIQEADVRHAESSVVQVVSRLAGLQESEAIQDIGLNGNQESAEAKDPAPVFRDTINSVADSVQEAEDFNNSVVGTDKLAHYESGSLNNQEAAVDLISEAELEINPEAAETLNKEAARTKFSKFSLSGEAVFEPGIVSMDNE